MTRARLDRRPADVAAMFDGTARRYDLLNDVLSGGQDRIWRRAVARAVDARDGETVLDLAAGTGTSSRSFTMAGARCVACDFSIGMLTEGSRRDHGRSSGVAFAGGDAMRLPFADGVFDAVTISFGLRNVVDIDVALTEMLRVTKPGGRLLVCEFSTIPVAALHTAYLGYLSHGLPLIARMISSNPEAYGYLAESIQDWPDQAGLAERIRAAGWRRVAWRNLSLGVVAMHRAYRIG